MAQVVESATSLRRSSAGARRTRQGLEAVDGRPADRCGKDAQGPARRRWRLASGAPPSPGWAGIGSTTSGCAGQEAGDLGLALLRLQRADAVDQPPAGLHPARRRRRAAWSAPRPGPATSPGRAAHSTSGWRRKVPVAEHGASSSTASNVRGRPRRPASAATISAARCPRAGQVLAHPPQAARPSGRRRRPAPPAASCRVFAAGRGAEVERALAGLQVRAGGPGRRRRRPAPTRSLRRRSPARSPPSPLARGCARVPPGRTSASSSGAQPVGLPPPILRRQVGRPGSSADHARRCARLASSGP